MATNTNSASEIQQTGSGGQFSCHRHAEKGSPRLTLRTNDNWKDVVRLAVDNDRLMIQPQKGRYFDADKAGRMLLYLEVENLSEVKLQGSGNIEFARSFKADNLQAWNS